MSDSNGISIMSVPVKNYQQGKHIIIIEKLFYEAYDFIEDSVGFNEGYFYDPNVKVELVKAPDSLIHIPFYIYS